MDRVAIRVGNSGEIEISGSIIALRHLSQAMLDLMNDRDRVNCVVEAAAIDPDSRPLIITVDNSIDTSNPNLAD